MSRIVVDPGHGGTSAAGSSTPFGALSLAGVAEKELTLDLARRLRARDPGRVLLTRDHDRNLSLGERARLGRSAGAEAFLSIHVGGASQHAEAWVHPRASAASRLFAGRVAAELESCGVFAPYSMASALHVGPLAVLDPDFHAPGGAACLVELGRFGDPATEARLSDPWHRERIADALSRAALAVPFSFERSERIEHFDIWHEVPLVEQLTGMSCWAAAAAMVVGWRDCIDIKAEEVAHGAGRWSSYRDGLEPSDVEAFARAWGLHVARPAALSVAALRRLLESYGPLWVGEASPGLHVVVIAGMHGDGTPDGTFVRIADPWPIGRGERYSLSFRELRANLQAAASLSDGLPQILHAGPGARGTSRRSSSLHLSRSRVVASSGVDG